MPKTPPKTPAQLREGGGRKSTSTWGFNNLNERARAHQTAKAGKAALAANLADRRYQDYLRDQDRATALAFRQGGGTFGPERLGTMGGGGGGGGGYGAYMRQLQAMKDQAIADLTGRRDEQFGQLGALRDAALPMINQYADTYQGQIGGIFADNQAQTAGYQNQLSQLGNDVLASLAGTANPIQADLAAQGFSAAPVQGRLNEAQLGARGLAGAQGGFNARLAQVMSQAQADYRGLGESNRQGALSTAQNEYQGAYDDIAAQYAEALMRLQMMGLG